MDNKEIAWEEFEKFTPRLRGDNLIVLDVGCGGNWHGVKFRDKNYNWIGMDIDKYDDVMLKGAMENIPLHNNMVDIVFVSHAFEHTIDPIKTISEFNRVLRPRGVLFLVSPYYCEPQIFQMDKQHNFVLTNFQIASLLEKNGFTILEHRIAKGNNIEEKDWSYITIATNVGDWK